MHNTEELRKVPRDQFDAVCHEAMMSADSAATKLGYGSGITDADRMRVGVRAAFAFAIGYGLVEVKPPSGEERWYRIAIDPEEVIESEVKDGR